MRYAVALLILAVAQSSPVLGQVRPESKPVARAGHKEPGTADLLKKLLAEHAEARARRTPESLARAAEIDKQLPDRDWTKVDVPATTFDFAADQEQKVRDKRSEGWDFDRLPPALVAGASNRSRSTASAMACMPASFGCR